jgi:hypothetical protein
MKRWLAALLLCSCGPGAIELPTPPSSLTLSAMAYDQPTGTVPIDNVTQTTTAANDRLEALQESRLGDLLVQALGALRQRLVDAGLPTSLQAAPPKHSDVQAWLRVDRTCQGWNDSAQTPSSADGTVTVTAVLQAGRLQRELWGEARACKGRVPVASSFVHPYLDGTLGVLLVGALPESEQQARAAFHVEGTLGTEMRTWNLSIDFRLMDGGVSVLVPVADGDIVATTGSEGLELRGSNGDFRCSIETGTCTPVTSALH